MGLRNLVSGVILVSFVLAAPPTVRSTDKVYIDCCNPSLNFEDKDMCKWAKDHPGKLLQQGNTLYEMVWSDCKVGEEPWRRYE